MTFKTDKDAILQDSGDRATFSGGAQKDVYDGKGRCDLIPLEILCGDKDSVYEDKILYNLAMFLRTDSDLYLRASLALFWKNVSEELKLDGDPYTMILELSIHYEQGAKKYDERNWEKGIPVHCFIDSAIRHYCKYKRGDDDEPHYRAFIWNILGALWTKQNYPELNDIPGAKNDAK